MPLTIPTWLCSKAIMELLGSCHCQAIKFKLLSKTPYPYIHCYCSICRKTDGGTGAAINIMGQASTFRILQGAERLKIYHVCFAWTLASFQVSSCLVCSQICEFSTAHECQSRSQMLADLLLLQPHSVDDCVPRRLKRKAVQQRRLGTCGISVTHAAAICGHGILNGQR